MRTLGRSLLEMSIGLRILANANIAKMAVAALVIRSVVKTMVKMLHDEGRN